MSIGVGRQVQEGFGGRVTGLIHATCRGALGQDNPVWREFLEPADELHQAGQVTLQDLGFLGIDPDSGQVTELPDEFLIDSGFQL